MKTTIDKAGRVVVPKSIRDELRLAGGVVLEVCERNGRIELTPLPAAISLEERAEGWVAVPGEELPALSDDQVRDTLERSRR